MPRQLVLDLPVRTARGRGDFFVSPANAAALAAIDGAWPQGKLILTGPQGSGKTHLAQVWATEAGAVPLAVAELARADLPDLVRNDGAPGAPSILIDDADAVAGDPVAETALFHLHNLVLAARGRLLLTARTAPARWPLALPDLASRLSATATATLSPPDDALLGAVLIKLFADRQLAVTPAVIAYLFRHMERSLATAQTIVAGLDARGLAEGRAVSRATVARWAAAWIATGPAGQ